MKLVKIKATSNQVNKLCRSYIASACWLGSTKFEEVQLLKCNESDVKKIKKMFEIVEIREYTDNPSSEVYSMIIDAAYEKNKLPEISNIEDNVIFELIHIYGNGDYLFSTNKFEFKRDALAYYRTDTSLNYKLTAKVNRPWNIPETIKMVN